LNRSQFVGFIIFIISIGTEMLHCFHDSSIFVECPSYVIVVFALA
jgi:hypothetical protein